DRALELLNLTRKTDTRSLPIGAGKDATPIKTDPEYTRGEIIAIIKREKVIHLDDLLIRRTLLAYLGQLTRALVEEIGDWLGDEMGWSAGQRKEEKERVIGILADKHGVRL
ncbi:MAG: glycerol-3-phosphate dehydrogenase C-terminal domain-containing protein, partial [Anaerolineales bacterium]